MPQPFLEHAGDVLRRNERAALPRSIGSAAISALLAIPLLALGCTRDDDDVTFQFREAVEAQGFLKVVIEQAGVGTVKRCPEDQTDYFRPFEAKDGMGHPVKGVVCMGSDMHPNVRIDRADQVPRGASTQG